MDRDKQVITSSDSELSGEEDSLEDKAWIRTADELFKIGQKRKRLDKKYKSLSNELRKRSENKTTKKGRYKYRLISRKGAIDYHQIPELEEVDLETYRKDPVDTWKLEVVV